MLIFARCRELALEWYRAQCRNIYAALYLYYKRSGPDSPGRLAIGEDCPPGYELASPQRLGPGATQDQIRERLKEICRRLPILPLAE